MSIWLLEHMRLIEAEHGYVCSYAIVLRKEIALGPIYGELD